MKGNRKYVVGKLKDGMGSTLKCENHGTRYVSPQMLFFNLLPWLDPLQVNTMFDPRNSNCPSGFIIVMNENAMIADFLSDLAWATFLNTKVLSFRAN